VVTESFESFEATVVCLKNFLGIEILLHPCGSRRGVYDISFLANYLKVMNKIMKRNGALRNCESPKD